MADKDLVKSCYWSVSINGSKLSDDRRECVESISIDETDKGSDTMTLVVHDPEFLYIEDNIFVEEATVSAEMGWHDDTHRVKFSGYISAIDIDFPDTGYPIMTITCLDKTHLMNRKKKKRTWDNVTRADVAEKIAQEYGFTFVKSPDYKGKKEDTISQSGTTDIAFLESLANEEDELYICKLKGDTLYYVKRGLLGVSVADLHYKEYPHDIVSFKHRINKETREEEVEEADINTDDKSEDSATASDTQTDREVQGESVKTSSVKIYHNDSHSWATF